MSRRNTEEVANKVRTEMTKEKLLKQFEDYLGKRDFKNFTNHKKINQLNRSYYGKSTK
jgi:tRNA U38,U39,U40 pseudouridine synthase TruA